MTFPASTRDYSLDWLRVIAFAILIAYHTGMFFVPWAWHVKNPEQSEALTWVMVFFSRWRLPLLFFISGGGVFFSLRRRGFPRFAAERLRRLLIPLLFGIFVVVPPQIYFERLTQGHTFASYWSFWKTTLDFVPYPQGSTSWHHLWFVAYILVYSLIGIPLFALLRATPGRRFADTLARWSAFPGFIYLVNIPSILIGLWLGPRWPTTHNLVADWANFTGSFLTFLWGFLICSSPAFLGVIERKRREFLSLALILTVAFYALRITGARPPLVATLVEAYLGMTSILALLGFARAWLNRPGAFLHYATEAVYPFYIAHQTITVSIAFLMIPWTAPIALKFPLLAAGTFLGSWLVFELARRHPVSRLLFGMKP